MRQLSFQAGITLTSGTGWFRPIIRESSWPIHGLILSEDGIQVEQTFLDRLIGFSIGLVPWERVLSIDYCWFGMRVMYLQCDETYEMTVTAPGSYEETTAYLQDLALHWNLFPRTQQHDMPKL